jgi:dolichol-phosphate mannosyltransferase
MENSYTLDSVTICMPVLNEVSVIESVVLEWIEIVNLLPSNSILLFEDGGSKDGTVGILQGLQMQFPSKIHLMLRDYPDGFGNSAKRLLASAETEWVFFTDSDGQYVASDFWILWGRRIGNDFVRGIKLGRKDPFIRRVSSLFWNKAVNFLFELPVHDVNTAFILIRKSSLNKVLPKARILKTMVLSEIVIRCVMENMNYGRDVYIKHRARLQGGSRATPGLKFLFVGLKQITGLFHIKKDYRVDTNHN